MALRINTNIAATKALRNLTEKDRRLVDSLEKLSSGFRINKGADDPAGLVVSEQMRAQIAGVNQAISNTELATSMVQTTEGALGEINNLLIRMRQLALHANNEGANDPRSLEADQIEMANAIASIGRIARDTQFGTRKLLDGTSGMVGAAEGRVSFVEASEATRTSPLEGYVVEVEQPATRAVLYGDEEITEDNVQGLSATLIEGGKTARVTGEAGDTPRSFFGRLTEEVQRQGLALDLAMDEDGVLTVRHQEFGSEPTFRAISSVEDVLSEEPGQARAATPGRDVRGALGGETARGEGRVLRGVPGNENTEGLAVRVEARAAGEAGRVHVVNNAVTFQTGPNAGQKTTVALPTLRPDLLGRQVDNPSGFDSLAEVDVTTAAGARDAIAVIDKAVNDMTLTRGRLGAFQRNNLETNMATLRVTAENLMAAESSIRDTDIAREIAEFTKHRILVETSAAMLAQANQLPGTVIDLIR